MFKKVPGEVFVSPTDARMFTGAKLLKSQTTESKATFFCRILQRTPSTKTGSKRVV